MVVIHFVDAPRMTIRVGTQMIQVNQSPNTAATAATAHWTVPPGGHDRASCTARPSAAAPSRAAWRSLTHRLLQFGCWVGVRTGINA